MMSNKSVSPRAITESESRHPDRVELLALTLDDLPRDRASALREHLTGCAACRLVIRDLLDESGGKFEDEVSNVEVRAAWAAVQGRLSDPEEGGRAGGG